MAIQRSPYFPKRGTTRAIDRYQDNDSLLAMRVKAIHERHTRGRKAPVQPFGVFSSNPNLEGRVLRNNLKSATFEPSSAATNVQ
ncbi:hypothetical protein [Nocardia phage P3.1]|nr:hypothetical protein [Nocardia phage P3.1]